MKKRIFSTLLGICMVFSLIQMPALAATSPAVGITSPAKWTNTARISLSIKLKSNTVTWRGEIEGKKGTTSITATYTLYKMNSRGSYDYVGSWTDSTTSAIYLYSTNSVSGTAGTYKLTISGTVTASGVAEAINTDTVVTLP